MNFRSVITLLFLITIALPAAAVTITERPDSINNGDTVYVTIRDLPEGATFTLLIESSFSIQPASEFLFQMSHFTMPFELQDSAITATLTGTDQNKLEVKKDDTIVTVSGKSVDGRYSVTKVYDITSGTYDYFRLSGTSAVSGNHITAQVQVSGTKKGPDDSEISFVVEGMPPGTITIASLVDGNQVFYKTIFVSGATPTPTMTGFPDGGSSGTPSGTPAPETWVTYTSPDGLAEVRASGVDHVSLAKVAVGPVPEGLMIVGGPYSLIPGNLTFMPPAGISFTVPSGTPAEGLMVAELMDGSWSTIPSGISGNEVTASITDTGTYALLAPLPSVSSPPSPEQTTLPATTMPVTTPAATTTTRAGLEAATVLLAAIIGLGLKKAL